MSGIFVAFLVTQVATVCALIWVDRRRRRRPCVTHLLLALTVTQHPDMPFAPGIDVVTRLPQADVPGLLREVACQIEARAEGVGS